ncbi:hypothetical protein [Candidatus Epulonipiscium viviparus]|uniref:hypothetical protein n=1 Tax=Candidatus Epulonipiscium viviparus TaxID=420336 RepID=UPI0027380959|nr:hypothetical protein [Candidatus Epulopiscium viviparus]
MSTLIGSRDQLDYTNKRYIIEVKTINLEKLFVPKLVNLDLETDNAVEKVELAVNGSEYILTVPNEYAEVENFGLGLTLDSAFADAGYTATFYKGILAADDVFDAVIDDPDIHISSAIKNGSYNISDSSELTILLEQEGGFRTVLHYFL